MKLDGSRIMIHPADVRGKWTRRRKWVFAVLIVLYLLAPFIPVGGHPMIQLDIEHRSFYLFGGTFNAQDFWMVLLLALSGAFGLLLVTAWHGRVWCGWACPAGPVFLEGLYRPIERFIEGPRERRLKLEHEPWTKEKILRRALKLIAFLVVSIVLGHSATAIIVSPRGLWLMITEGPRLHPEAFFLTTGITLVLWFTFSYFREQFCIVVCPYGRLQSVLQDEDSLAVTYDDARGEPRGKVSRDAAPGTKAGDCVDCKRCVQVCPTGIDIRNGLQMECLACSQCMDACDEVMVKLNRAPGLIRFMSKNEYSKKPARVARPRLFVYGAIMTVAVVTLVASLATRTPFEANIWRARGSNPFILDGDTVRNPLQIHVFNKNTQPAKFRCEVVSPVPAEIVLGQTEFELQSLTDTFVPVTISVDRKHLASPFEYTVVVHDELSGNEKRIQVGFLKPFGFGPK
jgi:cytochrome c oxidase accessory protein FixG